MKSYINQSEPGYNRLIAKYYKEPYKHDCSKWKSHACTHKIIPIHINGRLFSYGSLVGRYLIYTNFRIDWISQIPCLFTYLHTFSSFVLMGLWHRKFPLTNHHRAVIKESKMTFFLKSLAFYFIQKSTKLSVNKTIK